MRCKNCGWENEGSRAKCEKCNAPLNGSMAEHSHESRRNYERSTYDESLKATVRDSEFFSSQNTYESPEQPREGHNDGGAICNNCGYEVAPGMMSCPACGQPLRMRQSSHGGGGNGKAHGAHVCPKCGMQLTPGAKFCSNCGQTLRMGTVNAWDNPANNSYCTLRPISWARESRVYPPVTYSGETIELKRANTDPNNETITSKVQALLTHEGQDWYIEDKSDNHTTLVQVGRKFRLQSGDIIALGNRLFEFKG